MTLNGYTQTEKCTQSVRGRVIDSDTQLPLAGVTLKITPGTQQLLSDGHGYFRFSQVCSGIRYTISATSVGFDSLATTVVPAGDTMVTLQLHHGHIHLHDVDVVGHQQAAITSNPIRTVSHEQVAQAQGKTLADVFNILSGVSMLQTGTTIAKPVVNGMHSNRILILNNGVRHEGQQWGSEHAPEIDPFAATDFKLIKGAEGVRYGSDAIGGVIIASPSPLPIDPHLSGELNSGYQTNGRGAVLSGMMQSGVRAWHGLSWRIQGTAKRSGNVRTGDYYLGNTGLAEYNGSGALRYSHTQSVFDAYYSRFYTSLGIFSGAHAGTIDDIQARVDAGRPVETYPFTYTINVPRQRVAHDLGKLKWHRDYTRGGSSDIQYGVQRNHRREYDIRRGGRDALPMLDMVLTTQTFDANYQTPLYENWRTQVGTNLTLQVNNNVPGTLNTPLIPNYDSFTGGLFAIQRLIKDTHEWELGVRYDFKTVDAAGFDKNQRLYGGQREFHNISGSFGGVWHPATGWQLRSNVGLAWRAPHVNELYSTGLHHGAAVYEIGNAELASEQGYKWVFSPSYASGAVTIDLDLYTQYVRGYIYAQPSPGEFMQTIRGTFPVFRYRQTDAAFFGADLSLQYTVSDRLHYQLNTSVIRAQDVTDGLYLPYVPSDRFDHRLRWQLPVAGKVVSNTYVTFAHQWTLEQHRYEPGTDYAPPPPAYHIFSFHTGGRLALGNHSLEAGVSVTNLFDTLYKEYMNRFRYYSHNLGREVGIRLSYSF